MSYRWVPLLLAGVVFLAGLALADEPAGQDEPPVRLKKKKPKDDGKPATEPGKTDEKKKDTKKKDQPKAEPREAEPVTAQEEEKEVLRRVINNVRGVEERLAKNDLGEATQQKQRDILNDIESLIRRSENTPPQAPQQPDANDGGGGDAQNPMDNKNQQNPQGNGGKQPKSGSNKAGQQSKGQTGNGGGANQPGSGQKSAGKQRGGPQGTQKQAGSPKPAGAKQGARDGKGTTGGAGGDKDDHARNRNSDLYKDDWGHLPETLRAQMDAFSKPQPFLPKYDDLIKRYYRTIAEQGRRKGD
jgi:hypothetical protein